MSHSTHQLAMKGVDQTASAFASIQARAALTGAQIRRVVGGAISAASAYLSVRAVGSAIQELGELSDIAQKTSTSVDELTRATTAMGVLGINMDANSLAKAFQMMEKNTGRSGLQGFYDTIGELGKIPNTADRAAAAMQVFGRSGMEFMPLINAAKDSTRALEDVINAMPGIPDAAAKACDKAKDAMTIGANGIKRIWFRVIGWIASRFDSDLRVGAASAVAYLEYWVFKAGRLIRALFTETSEGTWKLTEVWKAACEDMVHSLLRTGVIVREFFVKLPLMVKMAFESVAGAALDLLMLDPEAAEHSLKQPWVRWFHELVEDAEKVMEERGIATGYGEILRNGRVGRGAETCGEWSAVPRRGEKADNDPRADRQEHRKDGRKHKGGRRDLCRD